MPFVPKNPSPVYQEFMRQEREMPIQKRNGEVELAMRHGDDWNMVKAAAEVGFRMLPAREQEALRLGFGKNGEHALNDVGVIEALANKASGPIPASSREIAMEIRLLENSLRKDRRGWLTNPAKRYRLARLYRAQTEVPAAVAALNQPVTSKRA